MTGRTLSHYQVLEPLGSGGMGEVFKARDTRLNRPVAIKILRSEHLSQAVRKQRFIQEAQAASALNHPNIVTIHDIGQAEGVDFLVMEFIAGRTLDMRIPRQGMRLNEALRVAVQIAEGLRRAHEAGIVHRDLKPSNIMAGDEGMVKILDFGLAKLTEPTGIGEDEPTRTDRPETEEDTILGTTAYMSPEQAEGRKLDARTDIFSFGVVLYEMLTGRKAFQGATRIATISAILKEEPKPIENIPTDLDKILRRCLRKDRDRRFQHMDDLKIALEEVREDSESGKFDATPIAATPAPKKRWPAIAAAAGLAVAAAGGYVATRSAPGPAATTGAILRQLTFDPGLTTEPALWAAGGMIAYASDRGGKNLDIWVQHLETKESRRLTTHEADDREPSFSPDGSRLAFRSERDGGGIYVMSTLGGGERRIADGGRSPKFSPDGQWIAYYTGTPNHTNPFATNAAGLSVVSSAGGAPKRLAPKFLAVSEPVWSPDAKVLLTFGGPRTGAADWWAVPIDGGAPVSTGAAAAFRAQKIQPHGPGAWVDDSVLFSADSGDARNIWQVRLDRKNFRVSGEARRLTSGNNIEGHASISGRRLVFSNIQENSGVWSLPADPNAGRITGEAHRITENLASNFSASVSADGTAAAYATQRGDGFDIVWMDLAARQERVVASTRRNPGPRISPDGREVAFNDFEGDKPVIRTTPVSGGAAKPIAENLQLRSWTADGTHLVVTRQGHSGLLNRNTGSIHLFVLPPPGGPSAPRSSPDRRWMVLYQPIENDRSKILLVPARPTAAPLTDWIQLNEGLYWDAVPEFSPDGKTLYFLSHRDGFRCHWALRIDPVTGKRMGEPFAVQHYHSPRRSPGYMRPGRMANAVARDKIVFTMAERTGNIWMAELP